MAVLGIASVRTATIRAATGVESRGAEPRAGTAGAGFLWAGAAFGLSAQAGVDIPFWNDWALSLEVWYIQIDTNATVRTDVGNVHLNTDIDPFVYNVGIAYRF